MPFNTFIHPFQNDPGTSQSERVNTDLVDGDANIDGRTLADFLYFFTQIAPHINYYDENLVISDWQPFFAKSLPFTLASIIKYNCADIKSNYDFYTLAFNKAPSRQGLQLNICLLYTSPSPRDRQKSRMPSSA